MNKLIGGLGLCFIAVGCGSEETSATNVAPDSGGYDGSSVDADAQAVGDAEADAVSDQAQDTTEVEGSADVETPIDAEAGPDAPPAPCTTRVTYGSGWIHGPNHPQDFDIADGLVTWDGSCAVDGSGNAIATLSNGWQPYFSGRSCVIALDYEGDCDPAPGGCGTRVSYGPSWLPGPNHPDHFDDVNGVVTWDGICHASGGESWALLSNGWTPYFSGASSCDLSFRHTQCGGLFANPVVNVDCPDPGVMKVGNEFFMACTSGHYAYPIRSSTDLVTWQDRGTVFTDASHPSWATAHFWAPELHAVGTGYVAYYSAKNGANDTFAIGAAFASNPAGPYQDIGHPLVTEPPPGAIDAHYFKASSGTHYILWKVDGNAVGDTTPIKIQELAADGLSVLGSATTILTNTLGWEGALVEGPWMVEHGGKFYLFYSGNGYASPSYGVGVARADSPIGPFEKASAPILTSKGDWAGPGHGSVVVGPSGDWVHVYHAWESAHVGQPPGRLVLVDRIQWENAWPSMRGAPSSRSQPMP